MNAVELLTKYRDEAVVRVQNDQEQIAGEQATLDFFNQNLLADQAAVDELNAAIAEVQAAEGGGGGTGQ